ncbi:TIGR02680 family protein [[Brevibacterium] frigoritolerans]|nr:TIGR02680 family protein [Peribacillus frigoritolerans]
MEDRERIREGIALLMENFWFTRKHDLDKYMLIRQNRKEIQKYFIDNFGYQVQVNNSIVKLEKIPSKAKPWMGIQDFTDTLDYIFFTSILSYLEDKSSDDIFIVSMLSEYIKQFLSQVLPIKWENYRHRLSFVRAMKFAEKQHLIEVMEGEINLYKDDESIEVLYRPTMISKYFTRFFSKPIQDFSSQEEMLEDRWKVEGFMNAKTRRQAISRKLFSSPLVYRNELDGEEKKYFANYGYSIIDAIEEYTPYEVETYRNELFLISKERNIRLEQFPEGKMLSQIALQFGTFVQKKINKLEENPEFELEIPRFVFIQWIQELQQMNGHGWSKEYREKFHEEIAKEMIIYLTEWKFLEEDTKAHSIILYPIITRVGGEYPVEYRFQRYFFDRLKEKLRIQFKEQQEYVVSMLELQHWINEFKFLNEIKSFNWNKVEDAIGGLITISDDRNDCIIDLVKVRKKDGKKRRMSMEQSNKWVINKAGILNYWYYDEEEFPFENGHLLIKGGNGSGKSVTTQSFLPLLLDGNKSPQRLDPFGTRSRKMIDYIFGESPEENEKTSYLYMEYKKRDTEEYITTGIGLKGNLSNDKVDSWYFILKNKRINIDFRLFDIAIDENGEKVKVPLSEKKLKNLIEQEKCGEFKTSQAEYAELVNNHIFKFESIQEFKEMVDLIVRIRAPKLSNNMGPSVLYEVLQSSLPELSMNDLRSLSETIQNIDEINERLEKAKYDLSLISSLSSKYNDYNFGLLSQKAALFMSMKEKRDKSKKGVEKAKKDWEKAKEQFNEKQNEVIGLGDELVALTKRVEHLKENDEYKMKMALLSLEETLGNMKEEWDQLNKSLEEKKHRYREVEASINQKKDEKDKSDMAIKVLIKNLDVLADNMEYSIHTMNRKNFEMAITQKKGLESYQRWETNAEEFKVAVEGILRILEREEMVKEQLGKQNEELLEETKQRDAIRNIIEQKRNELEKELEKLNTLIASKNERNEVFVLNKDELSYLAYSIVELFETTSVKEIERNLQQYFFTRKQKLGREEIQLEIDIETLKKNIIDKNIEIEKWEKKVDPVPEFRKEETEKVRRDLTKKGVPFISFYEAVEFASPLKSDLEKERIESALIEMGVLDSLIVHPEYMHMVNDSDSVLIPKPIKGRDTLAELLTVHLPNEVKELESITRDILKSISTIECEDQSFLTSFGHYQHGVVKGHVVPRNSSIYIGKESRKQYREMMLQTLRSELEEIENKKISFDTQLANIKERAVILQNEHSNFVSFKEVEDINDVIEDNQRSLTSYEKTIERLNKGITNLSIEYKEIRLKLIEKTEGRITPSTREAYKNVLDNINEYTSDLREIKQNINDFNSLVLQLEILESQLNQADNDVEEALDLSLQKEREYKRIKKEAEELRKTINEKGIGDIEQQILETQLRIQEIPEIKEGIFKNIGLLQGQLPVLEDIILQEKASVRFYQEAYQWSKEIFVLEVNRKLIETYDTEVLIVDEDMVALAQAVIEDDKEGARDRVQALRDKVITSFNEVRVQGLEDYSLNLFATEILSRDISDEGYEQFANELEKIESLSGRQLIQLTYDGSILSPQELQDIIAAQISSIQVALTSEDEKLYKEVILDNIGERLRELIAIAESWNEEINEYMNQTKASNGLKLWLQWKPRKATEEGEITTAELVSLLQKDPVTRGEFRNKAYRRATKYV